MKAIEDACLALAIFGLAVAAGWWWVGGGADRQAVQITAMQPEHGE